MGFNSGFKGLSICPMACV